MDFLNSITSEKKAVKSSMSVVVYIENMIDGFAAGQPT
jgi:hypothetical protein